MASGISLDDRHAWDDAALIDSWEEALAEYKKYHSIQAQGKRLEDVLSEGELKELQEEHGSLIEVVETVPSIGANNHTDQSHAESLRKSHESQPATQVDEPAASGQQRQPMAAAAEAPSQAILGTVQDENLRNVMMSWYYAGYYTGLYAGQNKDA